MVIISRSDLSFPYENSAYFKSIFFLFYILFEHYFIPTSDGQFILF